MLKMRNKEQLRTRRTNGTDVLEQIVLLEQIVVVCFQNKDLEIHRNSLLKIQNKEQRPQEYKNYTEAKCCKKKAGIPKTASKLYTRRVAALTEAAAPRTVDTN